MLGIVPGQERLAADNIYEVLSMNKTTWLRIGVVAFAAVALGYSVQLLNAQSSAHDHGATTKQSPASKPAASQPASQPTSAPSTAKVVNARCPIMGSAIDRANVPDSLTREYKGQKVGFCCGGCPAAWDNLTPEQKDAKLKANR